jgi:DNA processing protein
VGDDVIDTAELGAWLRLLLVPGVGRETARQLLAAFGSPEAAVQAPVPALQALVGERVAASLRRVPSDWQQQVDAVQAWAAGGPDRHVLALGDPRYPGPLLESPDPPLLLYVQGDPRHLAQRSIAIVGSRRPSAQGTDNAREFARALADAGYVVVSGLALGIDGAAHEGALAGGGPTVAVVGTGLDRVYPRRHLDLARRIAAHGALVSEYLPGTPPLPEHFPQRNRIIAGLSAGTLVVEAALQSGSLITARLANEAGRDVFAIPGSIHAPQSRGCHALIRDGAKLVESAADVLDEWQQMALPGLEAPAGRGGSSDAKPAPPGSAAAAGQTPGQLAAPRADRPEDPLLEALGHDPVSLDSLLARTGRSASDLLARLLDLELDGQVARLPGGLFQRRVST